jgi:hypothetical protein
MTKATWHAASAAAHLVVDEVGISVAADDVRGLHDEKKGAAWAASTAVRSCRSPRSLGQTASLPFMDPHMREAKTFIDGIKNKIPGQRETLLPKRDWLGQPVPNPQYGNIIRQRQAITDPVSIEMDRLQIHPGLPQDRIGGVKLSRPLYDEFQVAGAYDQDRAGQPRERAGLDRPADLVRINMIHANINRAGRPPRP